MSAHVDFLHQAISAERANKLEEAFNFYQLALSDMLDECKLEQDPLKKQSIQMKITQYMEIAEKLKARLETSKSNSAKGARKAGSKAPKTPAVAPNRLPDSHNYTSVDTRPKVVVQPKPTTPSIMKPPARAPGGGAITPAGTPRQPAGTPRGTPRGVDGAVLKVAEDPKMLEYESQISSEMLDTSPGIKWEDIAGLSYAKQTLQEAVILPNLRPDLFTGLRTPPRGVLLFGPPGTGKTLLAKAVATESGFSFFSITASSVTSKYLGEGEKLMKALFSVARKREPAVIFFDEIDAIMSARKESEHEASRRIKTEFMTQLDGAATSSTERVLVMAATNIPWELDEAVLRRFVKRIYVPLPDAEARRALIIHQINKHHAASMGPPSAVPTAPTKDSTFFSFIFGSGDKKEESCPMSMSDLNRVVQLTDGYSGSDLNALCHEAAMGPIREIGFAALKTVRAEDVRQLAPQDFVAAIAAIRPSVSPASLEQYAKWAEQFGVK